MLPVFILMKSYMVVYQSELARFCCSNKYLIIRDLHSCYLLPVGAMVFGVLRASEDSSLHALAQLQAD